MFSRVSMAHSRPSDKPSPDSTSSIFSSASQYSTSLSSGEEKKSRTTRPTRPKLPGPTAQLETPKINHNQRHCHPSQRSQHYQHHIKRAPRQALQHHDHYQEEDQLRHRQRFSPHLCSILHPRDPTSRGNPLHFPQTPDLPLSSVPLHPEAVMV